MLEIRADKAPLVEVEKRGNGTALVTVRQYTGEIQSESEDGPAVSYEYAMYQFDDIWSEDLADKVAASMDAVLEACRANEIRKAEKAEALMSALYQGTVCTDEGGHLNLRLKPSTAGRVLDELENGSSVSVLEETNASWLKVSAGGRTGYVFRRYIQKKAGSAESTDDTENTQNGWGVFIPCSTKETADTVASCFANAAVCKRGADD